MTIEEVFEYHKNCIDILKKIVKDDNAEIQEVYKIQENCIKTITEYIEYQQNMLKAFSESLVMCTPHIKREMLGKDPKNEQETPNPEALVNVLIEHFGHPTRSRLYSNTSKKHYKQAAKWLNWKYGIDIDNKKFNY